MAARSTGPSPSAPGEASLGQAAVSGTGWGTAQTVLNKCATAVAMIIVARYLSPDSMGVASLALTIGSFAVVLPPSAMGDVLVTYRRRLTSVAPEAERLVVMFALGSSVAILLASPLIALAFSAHDTATLTALVALVAIKPLSDALSVVPLTWLRTQFRFRSIATVEGACQAASTGLTVAMAVGASNPTSIVAPQMLGFAARAAWYRRLQRAVGERNSRPIAAMRARLLAHFLHAATAQYVHNAVFAVPQIAIGLFSRPEENGYFGLAFMLATQTSGIIASQISMVLQPVFRRLHHDRGRQASAFLRITAALGAVAVPVSMLQIALAPSLFRILFARDWDQALPVFAVMSAAQLFYFVVAPTIALLKSQRRFGTFLRWQTCHIGASLILYPASASSGGALGVAFADLALWAISAPISAWLAIRGSGTNFRTLAGAVFMPWATALPISALAFAAARFLADWGLWGDLCALLVVGPAALVLALVAIRVSQPATAAELAPVLGKAFNRLRSRPSSPS
jgi:O-antigen/teichoic acid export membrane protein